MAYDVSKEKKVTVAPGVELALETFGDYQNPAILMIQGAGNSMISWGDGLCQMLADGGRFVIRYDSRDAGRSTSCEVGRPNYTLRDLETDAVSLLDALSIKKAHVVGLSQGAAIGQLLAIDHPDRLLSITLISGTPGGPGHEASELPPMTDEICKIFAGEGGLAEPDWNDKESVANYLVENERPFAGDGIFDADWFRENGRRVFDRTIHLAAQLTNPFMLDANPAWRDQLGAIKTPTLVLHGTEDPLFSLAHGEALAKEIPNATFIALEGIGHAHMIPAIWDTLSAAILSHTEVH